VYFSIDVVSIVLISFSITAFPHFQVLLLGGESRKSREISNTAFALIYNPARDEWDSVGGGGGAKGGLLRHQTHLMADGAVAVIPGMQRRILVLFFGFFFSPICFPIGDSIGSDFWCTYLENKSQNHRIDVKAVNIGKSSIVDIGWTNASCGNSVNLNGAL
jgi:hypothetical protein